MVRSSPSSIGTSGLHPSVVSASVVSGRRTAGSSTGRSMWTTATRTGQLDDPAREVEHGQLVRVADVDRPGLVAAGQGEHPGHEVVDVADRPGLHAVAGHRHRLAAQRLPDEGGDRPPVVRAHPRPEGVEDPHDAGVDPVGPAVGRGHRLGEPLGLVVDAARAHRVDVAPVGLRLRVHLRVAVHLGGGGRARTGPPSPCQAQRVQRADRADLERLDRQLEVVDRRGRAREVQHHVDRPPDVDVVGDVGADQPEARVGRQVRDVVR